MPPAPAAIPPGPKQARARETRRRLLDAAVDELVEQGYAGLRTPSVAVRAGVSRGAQQNHFPHKITLITEAVRHLSLRQRDELHAAVAGVPRGRARVRTALDVLFEQYSGPLFASIIDLSLAARGDAELRDVVATEERMIAESIHDTANAIFGADVVDSTAFTETWVTVLSAIRGLALLKLLGHPPEAIDRQWRAMRRRLLDLLIQTADEGRQSS